MEIKRTITIGSEEETRNFGLALADELAAGDVLALIGDLGTGKTALTRYIAEGLGIKTRVNSPTFTSSKNTGKEDSPYFILMYTEFPTLRSFLI